MCYFFFSYARENRKNAERQRPDGSTFNLVDDFFERLCLSVSDITGINSREVGYRDVSNLDISAPWPQELIEAMLDSQVLVALISPHYFNSLNCGREFEVFVRRFMFLKEVLGRHDIPSRIVPIFWMNADHSWPYATPQAKRFLERFQWTGPGMPEEYPSVGLLRQFLFGRPHAYDQICFHIADRIKFLGESEPHLPPLDGIDDFGQLPSAFDPNQEDDKPVEALVNPVLDLSEMPAPPGVPAGPAPPALHLGP